MYPYLILVFIFAFTQVSAGVVDPFEPNDSPAAATPVECGFTAEVTLDPPGDDDYFRVEAMPGDFVGIDVDADILGSELISAIGTWDSAGNFLGGGLAAPCPGEAPSYDPCWGIWPPDDNVVIVDVIADIFTGRPLTAGPYTVTISCYSPLAPDALEPDDTPDDATPIECPGYVSSGTTIHARDNEDWYRLTGPANTLVEVDIDAFRIGNSLESWIWLGDSAFNELAFSDNSVGPGETGSLDPWTAVIMPDDGIVNILVSGVSFDEYTLDVMCTARSDMDSDGIADDEDNCRAFANADQVDTDGDGIGNLCDTDLDNSCDVDFGDLTLLKQAFLSDSSKPHWNPNADFNSDGFVNFGDLAALKRDFDRPFAPSGRANLCRACGVEDQGLDPSENFGQPMFLRGSFNDWGAAPNAAFTNFGDGTYQVEFELAAGAHEYKIADFGWTLEYAFPWTHTPIGPPAAPIALANDPAGLPNVVLYTEQGGCFNWTIEVGDAGNPPDFVNLTVTRVE